MAEQASILQDGVDRFRDAFGSIEDEIQRVQKDLKARRRSFEKQLNSSRRDFEKRTKKLRTDLRRNPTVKQIDSLRKRASRQLEQGVTDVLSALQIASKNDVQRIDRKISQLTRKVKEIERRKRANGQAARVSA